MQSMDIVGRYPRVGALIVERDKIMKTLKIGQLVWWYIAGMVIPCRVLEEDELVDNAYWVEPLFAPPESVDEYDKALESRSAWIPRFRPGHAVTVGDEIFISYKDIPTRD